MIRDEQREPEIEMLKGQIRMIGQLATGFSWLCTLMTKQHVARSTFLPPDLAKSARSREGTDEGEIVGGCVAQRMLLAPLMGRASR